VTLLEGRAISHENRTGGKVRPEKGKRQVRKTGNKKCTKKGKLIFKKKTTLKKLGNQENTQLQGLMHKKHTRQIELKRGKNRTRLKTNTGRLMGQMRKKGK